MAEYIERRTAIEHLNVWCGGCGSAVECILAEPAAARFGCRRWSDMSDITSQPWAEWLENSLETIIGIEPECLCIVAKNPDGAVFTGYYNADATEKAVFAHNIQSDVTMDIIRANIGEIKEMLEEGDDG